MQTIGGEIKQIRAKQAALLQHEQFARDHKLPVRLTIESYLEWKRGVDKYAAKIREMHDMTNLLMRSQNACDP